MLMTQKEVAQELRVSVQTLRRWRNEGRIQFMNWGYRTIRFSSSEIEKFKQMHVKNVQAAPEVRA